MKKLVLLILIVIIALLGCTTKTNDKQSGTDDKITNELPNTKPDNNNDKDSIDTDKKYGVGETVDINGVKLTLESVDMSYGDRDEEFSAFAPEKGKVFAVCNFLVENNSKEDLDISSLYFNAYEDGFAVDSYIFTDGIGVKDLSGTASPNKMIKGALVYEVSEEFKELELEYQPSVWNDKKVTFIYKRIDE